MAKNCYYCLVLLLLLLGCRGRVSVDTINTTVPEVISNSDNTSSSSDDNENTVTVEEDNNVVTLPSNAEQVDKTGPDETQRLVASYMSQIGVREATGKNDGKDVEKYLASTGFGKGYAWCAAFVHWNLEEADIPNTVTAWSPTAENRKNIVFKLREFKQDPIPGDVFTLFYTNLGRIGHTGFFHKKISDITFESVEGNTNVAGSREGDGVYKKYRSFNSTYSISRWVRIPN